MKFDLTTPCEDPYRFSQGSLFRSTLLICMTLALLLAGCSGINLNNLFTTPTLPVPLETPSLEAEPTALPPTEAGIPDTLVLWVPPQFDPALGTPAAKTFNNRLQSFADQYPGLQIKTRVKAVEGNSGLLNSLSAAALAAPAAVPDIIALPRPDMEVAALKGLIFPVEEISQAMTSPDWYDYAREISQVQGSIMCLPFAGDALALVYRPQQAGDPADSWNGLVDQGRAIAFYSNDTQSLLTMALYISAGGLTEDASRRPTLQAAPLEAVLKTYYQGSGSGVFPAWLPTLNSSAQNWQAYTEQRANLAVTWSSNYLFALPADTNIAPLPGITGNSASLATAWSWCITGLEPQQRALSAALISYLLEPEYQANWTTAAGYLPTRPTALAGWENQSLRTTVSEVVLSAHALPSNDQLYTLGPVLHDATQQVLRQQATPSQAAQAAVQPFLAK